MIDNTDYKSLAQRLEEMYAVDTLGYETYLAFLEVKGERIVDRTVIAEQLATIKLQFEELAEVYLKLRLSRLQEQLADVSSVTPEEQAEADDLVEWAANRLGELTVAQVKLFALLTENEMMVKHLNDKYREAVPSLDE